ncbi:NADH dehydrogenase [ubiquinone] flavoprotein 1, mitochondrial [Scaptodrosophila lebanonensis]|uniref:NADH dehydrogenase [ubiquinone] flavoprotein 1, mitochondrial n=1 Tax=Drosophila lebanonensis TaxID=7225 RepID=A0A6J2U838_DROLE|nr:NADH dehydrogenase [ubiquinone] flavoprotein 1, mitochondrial [Scaptodrosophila lebanonensis]
MYTRCLRPNYRILLYRTPVRNAQQSGKPPAPPPDAKASATAPPAASAAKAKAGPTSTRKEKLPPPEGIITNTKKEFGRLHDCDRIFQNLYGRHDWRLKGACQRGDWYRTADLIEMGPDWIMTQVKKSGLRGRGGAGFYVGHKWEYLRSTEAKGKVLVMNCAEGEPGTCKDREIIRHEPHKLIEGLVLAGYTMGCERAVIYVRNKFYNEACNLQFAIAEAYKYGLLGSNACDTGWKFDINVQRGDRYICGEETALINCLEGKMGRPRRRPPYLSEKGLFGHPSLVINAESIAVLPTLLRRGPGWFACLGRSYNSGTKLFNISGHVNQPCTVEEEMSIPLRQLIECHAGGVRGGWDNLLAVFPGGLSTPLINKQTADDVSMDYDCLESKGSSLGSGAVIVMNKQCDPLMTMLRAITFYKQHTCKQCTPCREGSIWLPEIFKRFNTGEAQPEEVDWLPTILKTMEGTTICALSDSQVNVTRSMITNFREVIMKRIETYCKGGE